MIFKNKLNSDLPIFLFGFLVLFLMLLCVGSAVASEPYYIYDEDLTFSGTITQTVTNPPTSYASSVISRLGNQYCNGYGTSLTSEDHVNLFPTTNAAFGPYGDIYAHYASYFRNSHVNTNVYYFDGTSVTVIPNYDIPDGVVFVRFRGTQSYSNSADSGKSYVLSAARAVFGDIPCFAASSSYDSRFRGICLYVPYEYLANGFSYNAPTPYSFTQRLQVMRNDATNQYAIALTRNGYETRIKVVPSVFGSIVDNMDVNPITEVSYDGDFVEGRPIWFNGGVGWGWNYKVTVSDAFQTFNFEFNEMTRNPLAPSPTPTPVTTPYITPVPTYTPPPLPTYTTPPVVPTSPGGLVTPPSNQIVDDILDFRLPDSVLSATGIVIPSEFKQHVLTRFEEGSVFYNVLHELFNLIDAFFSGLNNVINSICGFIVSPVSYFCDIISVIFSNINLTLAGVRVYLFPLTLFGGWIITYIPSPVVNIALAFFAFDLAFVFFKYFLPSMIEMSASGVIFTSKAAKLNAVQQSPAAKRKGKK